ncbi:hypothetical protein G9A89_005136 [Geosiphon pyriformis]|nr:hypothetical protein G9A89_005136 [Geosiphon pyriformis]
MHKGVFHGPAGSSFTQKKKVVVGNIKHSGDEKDVFLDKPVSGGNMFSDVDGKSNDSEGSVLMAGISASSLLGSAANTPKAKIVISGVVDGSSLSSINYDMDENAEDLPPPLNFPLSKRWVDPKVVKTPMEVAVKKSYALDINLSAMEGKSTTAKTQAIKKIFSVVNGFRGATTPSKFEGIIRSTFTSEESMIKTMLLAGENEIIVNTNLMKSGVHSDRAIVIKEIPMDIPKEMIVAAVAEFGEIKVLLFTLLVGTTAHDLSNLLDRAGGKTCIINRSLDTGNRICCAVVGFESENDLNSAFLTEPVFGGVRLLWARFDVIWCEKCGHLGYSAFECDALNVLSLVPIFPFKKPISSANCLQLAKLYARKNVSISRPAAFGGKSWAQVVSVASSSDGSSSGSGFDSSAFSLSVFGLGGGGSLFPNDNFLLGACLVSLERFLGLLHDQVSHIVHKLSGVNLVPLASSSSSGVLAVPMAADIDMILNTTLTVPVVTSSLPSVGLNLGLSSSKVLTSKVSSLESKLAALDAFVSAILGNNLVWKVAMCNVRGMNNPAKQNDIIHWHKDMNNLVSIFMESKLKGKICSWIVNKFDGVQVFTSNMESGYLGAGVVIVMDSSLARHVCKILEVPGRLLSIRLLFRNKLSVSILGLYANAFSVAQFSQAGDINSLIAKAGIAKTIDYVLIFSNLVNVVVGRDLVGVGKYFDTDHQAVSMWVGLGGLLDVQLNFVRKQTNKDHWKYNCKGVDDIKWAKFKKDTAANAAMFYDDFLAARIRSDLDSMWVALHKVMCLSAKAVFKRK